MPAGGETVIDAVMSTRSTSHQFICPKGHESSLTQKFQVLSNEIRERARMKQKTDVATSAVKHQKYFW